MEKNYDFISEYKKEPAKPKKYEPHNYGFISDLKPREFPTEFKTNNQALNNNDFKLSEYEPISEFKNITPPKPIKSVFEEEYPTYHKGTDLFMDEIEAKEEKTKKNPVKKSIKAPKLKEAKLKKSSKIVSKTIIITAIIAGLVFTGAKIINKVQTHMLTEEIKVEIMDELYEQYKEIGFDIEHLNMKEIINYTSPEHLKNNIFGNYLLIKNNYDLKEQNELLNHLVKKAGLADSFNRYLIDEGYHHREYYSSNGEGYFLVGDKEKWENAMEAQALKEKEAKEKEEEQIFEEFQNYSKGAR